MGNNADEHRNAINRAKRRGLKGTAPRAYCAWTAQVRRLNPNMSDDAVRRTVEAIKRQQARRAKEAK